MLRKSVNVFTLSRSTERSRVARTAGGAVRVFSLAIIATAPFSIAVSKLQRPFLSDRYFFIAVRVLRWSCAEVIG
jgi:hypothetical protein